MRGRLGKQARKEAAILEGWEAIVGAERVSRLVPLRLRGGVLWVGVASPALLYEVAQFERAAILSRLQEVFPKFQIEDVRFRLG
jgi:hypothetical protein